MSADAPFAYDVGIGVTGESHCDLCEATLTEENPLISSGQGVGANCCR